MPATAAGIAILSEIFFAALGHHPIEHSYIRAIQYVTGLDIGLLVVCFGVSLFLPRPPAAKEPAAAPAPE